MGKESKISKIPFFLLHLITDKTTPITSTERETCYPHLWKQHIVMPDLLFQGPGLGGLQWLSPFFSGHVLFGCLWFVKLCECAQLEGMLQ